MQHSIIIKCEHNRLSPISGSKPQCGREKHTLDRCPAKNAVCHRCSQAGHFEAQCFSKAANELNLETAANELNLEMTFLDAVTETDQVSSWTVTLLLNNRPIHFKMDTGADVTAISEEIYQSLEKVDLQATQNPSTGQPTKP